MKTLEELIMTSPEIGMKHYDRTLCKNSRALQQQNLAAKEASYIQAVGYVPSVSISTQDWEDQVQRNKRSAGEYKMTARVPRSGSMS